MTSRIWTSKGPAQGPQRGELLKVDVGPVIDRARGPRHRRAAPTPCPPTLGCRAHQRPACTRPACTARTGSSPCPGGTAAPAWSPQPAPDDLAVDPSGQAAGGLVGVRRRVRLRDVPEHGQVGVGVAAEVIVLDLDGDLDLAHGGTRLLSADGETRARGRVSTVELTGQSSGSVQGQTTRSRTLLLGALGVDASVAALRVQQVQAEQLSSRSCCP
jgi:hypothetical protein